MPVTNMRYDIKWPKLIRYHFPPIVKHVLAPQDGFSMLQKVGFGETPPLLWEFSPRFPVFGSESVLIHVAAYYRTSDSVFLFIDETFLIEDPSAWNNCFFPITLTPRLLNNEAIIQSHTSYLSFLLHRQDFRKPNFTPKKTTKDTKNTKNVSEKVKCMQSFLTQSWKMYTWQEIFTQTPMKNMRNDLVTKTRKCDL